MDWSSEAPTATSGKWRPSQRFVIPSCVFCLCQVPVHTVKSTVCSCSECFFSSCPSKDIFVINWPVLSDQLYSDVFYDPFCSSIPFDLYVFFYRMSVCTSQLYDHVCILFLNLMTCYVLEWKLHFCSSVFVIISLVYCSTLRFVLLLYLMLPLLIYYYIITLSHY